MAVLEKIRVKFGLAASIIIAIGLLSFIIDPSELTSAIQSMSSKYDVGVIGGNKISYNDFQADVQDMTTINETLSGQSAQSSEQQKQIRDAVWQNLIYKNLFDKNVRAAGIEVGKDEIVDLTTGNNLSPLISQNPAFLDENGSFSVDQLNRFLQSLDADQTGNLRLYWNYLQNSILNNQYDIKYASLFSRPTSENPLMLRKEIEQNNNTTDVDFVMVPFGYQEDSSIVVSDSEIKAFYNSHKKFFRRTSETRDMEYVVFEVVPSASDIEAEKAEVAGLYDEFSTTDNMKAFLMKNSDRQYDEYWYKAGDLKTIAPEIDSYVWGEGNDGKASDIITKGNTFYMARVMDSAMIPDSAYVQHILLQGTDADHLADSLLAVVKGGESISNLAAQYSADKGSNVDGQLGNIGWMTQSYMIPGFESVFTAKTGEPFILKTQYGTHVVVVSQKSAPVAKKQVAVFQKETLASKETFNSFYSQANKFATAASGSLENYKKAVDTMGVYSHPVNNMLESSENLGGIDDTKEVTRWVFENKPGKVSDIITVNTNYFFVVANKAVHKKGYATVEEVASSIRSQLYQEKLQAKMLKEVSDKIQGLTDLDAIAEKLGTSVSHQSGIAFSAINNQSLDPAFVGALSVAPEGKVSGPVVGDIAVYVFKVTGRDTGSFYTEDDAKNRDAQLAAYNTQMIIPVMMDEDGVEDNRARFF